MVGRIGKKIPITPNIKEMQPRTIYMTLVKEVFEKNLSETTPITIARAMMPEKMIIEKKEAPSIINPK